MAGGHLARVETRASAERSVHETVYAVRGLLAAVAVGMLRVSLSGGHQGWHGIIRQRLLPLQVHDERTRQLLRAHARPAACVHDKTSRRHADHENLCAHTRCYWTSRVREGGK